MCGGQLLRQVRRGVHRLPPPHQGRKRPAGETHRKSRGGGGESELNNSANSAGIFKQSIRGYEPIRNRVVVPARQATHTQPGGIGSLKCRFWGSLKV